MRVNNNVIGVDVAHRVIDEVEAVTHHSGADVAQEQEKNGDNESRAFEQILLDLKGAGLVRSKRGVGGGYVLAKAPADIRLSEIISAVDGPITLGDFGQPHQDGSCDHEGQCVLLAIWDVAGQHMREHLDAYTLESIAAAAAGNGPWPKTDPHHHH